MVFSVMASSSFYCIFCYIVAGAVGAGGGRRGRGEGRDISLNFQNIIVTKERGRKTRVNLRQ